MSANGAPVHGSVGPLPRPRRRSGGDRAGRARVLALAPLFQAVSSADYGHVATWFERPRLVAELTVWRGSVDDAVRMAEVVTFDSDTPALPPDHLGPATATLSTGPFPSPVALDPLSAWRLSWVDSEGSRSLTVRRLLDVPDVLDLLDAFTVASETTTVNGRPALAYATFDPERGTNGIASEEPDGLVVQVSALGLGAEEIEAVASPSSTSEPMIRRVVADRAQAAGPWPPKSSAQPRAPDRSTTA